MSQFRSSNSLRSNSSNASSNGTNARSGTGFLTGSSNRMNQGVTGRREKDRYSDAGNEDDEIDLLSHGGAGGRPPGLRGRGEAEGGFDEGWIGADRPGEEEEENMGLLGRDQVGP